MQKRLINRQKYIIMINNTQNFKLQKPFNYEL